MGLPVEINPLFVSSTGGYTVGRSLRFRASASAYLSRTIGTPSTTTNTFSAWVKRGSTINSAYNPILMCTNNNSGIDYQLPSTSANDTIQILDNGTTLLATSAVYRDPSAWYHVVVVWDSTNATSTDRVRLYVNGSRVTAFGTTNYPVLNAAFSFFSASNPWQIGSRQFPGALYFDGYMAEINYIDGQALTASSFGAYDTNGVWQPAKYTGTYGTNGFYLPFSNTSSTTTLVADASGNGNNWTPNNISLTAGTTYDSMIDSPTVSASSSNYCVWNPNWKDSTLTISDGNLKVSSASNSNGLSTGTIAVSSGKWYWEATVGGSVSLWAVGIISTSVATPNYTSLTTGNSYAWNNGATKYNGQTGTSYGATYTTGDVLGVALDLDGGTITFYKNNTSQGTAFTGISGTFTPMNLMNASSDVSTNFGQRPFAYTPPTGYSALNTYNLPAATIKNGAQYMAATLYTGNGGTQSINNAVNGVSFQPDAVWYKIRSTTDNHLIFDSIRGAEKYLSPNLTIAESGTGNGTLTAFNSNGFSVGSNVNGNANGSTFVGWQWKGGGTGVTNTSGSITSTVSANTTAGFSIVTGTAPATSGAFTTGHGLGVVPAMIITKIRSGTLYNWWTWHTALSNPAQSYVALNLTNAAATDVSIWANTAPTSSVWSMTSGNYPNTNQQFVAYCFSAVSGYSAFGKYTGNGSADGPFVFTNFRPRWLLVKRTDSASDWRVTDSSRSAYNAQVAELFPSSSAAETSTSTEYDADYLSNGFKLRSTNINSNASGGTYIYMAFAENPFNSSRAR